MCFSAGAAPPHQREPPEGPPSWARRHPGNYSASAYRRGRDCRRRGAEARVDGQNASYCSRGHYRLGQSRVKGTRDGDGPTIETRRPSGSDGGRPGQQSPLRGYVASTESSAARNTGQGLAESYGGLWETLGDGTLGYSGTIWDSHWVLLVYLSDPVSYLGRLNLDGPPAEEAAEDLCRDSR